MSNGKLNFSIALSLLTNNFKKGSQTIQRQIQQMQYRFLAFASVLGMGGLSLGNFVGRLRDAAKEAEKANITLKNVSSSSRELAENQKFLIDLSKKYSVNLTSLTANYAKFAATANQSGMALADQQKIFDAVSLASKSFILSVQETDGVFLALSQMMGKGKVSMEELRKQMGEKLPIAVHAMAKGLGVSIPQMEKMIGKGKVLSNEALPKFADALRSMVKGFDTDTIDGWSGKIENQITKLSEKMKTADFHKVILRKISELLDYVLNNTKNVINVIVNLITSVLIGKAINSLIKTYQKLSIQAMAMWKKQQADIKKTGVEIDVNSIKINKFGNTAKLALAKLAIGFKSLLLSFAPMAIISGLMAIIQYITGAIAKQKELNNRFKEYRDEAEKAITTNEIVQLEATLKVLNDKKAANQDYADEQKRIEGLLGVELGKQDDINKKVRDRIKLLKEAAKADFYSTKVVETENKIADTANSLKGKKDTVTKEELTKLARYSNSETENGKNQFRELASDIVKRTNVSILKLDAAVKSTVQDLRILDDANKNLGDAIKNGATITQTNNTTTTTDDDDKKKKKTDLEQAEQNYTKSLKELDNSIKIGIITQSEYDAELNKLKEETNNKIGALLGEEALNNKIFNETKDYHSKEKQLHDSYLKELSTLNKNYTDKVITENEYIDNLTSLNNNTLKALSSMNDVDLANNQYAKTIKQVQEEIKRDKKYKYTAPDAIDHIFDYKKTEKEKLGDQKDYSQSLIDAIAKSFENEDIVQKIKDNKGNLDGLKSNYNGQAKELIDLINNELNNVKNLDEAIKLSELKTDIKDLTNELDNGTYEAVKGIGNELINIVGGVQKMVETLESADTTVFEKIAAVFSLITNSIDGVLQTIKTINNLTEVFNKLTQAKELQNQVDNITTQQQLSNSAQRMAMTGAETAAETAASGKKIVAGTAETAVNAAKGAAKLPFPASLVAVGAAVAGVIALLSSLPKFAGGGIVSGSSVSGDKVLARVNSGEMILNKGQQATLFSILNGRTSGGVGGGDVEFVIRGDKLIGAINNYNKKKR
jgi:tape measure domain-containing protein